MLEGRRDEMEQARRSLDAGRSVTVYGPAGVGKTRLLTEIGRSREHEGCEVLWVRGVHTLDDEPLAPLLQLTTASGDGQPAEDRSAGAVLSDLYRRSRRRPVLLAVDDAHLFDDATASLVHQVAASETIDVAATVRTGEPAPPPVTALWKDDLADRIDLCPLLRPDVDAIAEALLGSVAPADSERLWHLSQGLPLFVIELIEAGLGSAQPHSQPTDGSVSAPWSHRLGDLIRHRLDGLQPPARTLIEAMAMLGTAPISVLEALEGREWLDHLARRQLATITGTNARCAHPLHAEGALRSMTPDDAAQLRIRLIEAFETAAPHDRPVLRAKLHLDAGRHPPLETVRLAVGEALASRRPLDAERLARTLLEMSPDNRGRAALAQALAMQGRWSEAEEAFEAAVHTAPPEEAAELWALWITSNFEYRTDLADVLVWIERALRHVPPPMEPVFRQLVLRMRMFVDPLLAVRSDMEELAARTDLNTHTADLVRFDLATCSWLVGQIREARSLLEPLVADPERLDPLERGRLIDIAGCVDAWTLDAASVYDAAPLAIEQASTSDDPDFALHVLAGVGIPLATAGRAAEAADVFRRMKTIGTYARDRRHVPLVAAYALMALTQLDAPEQETAEWFAVANSLPETPGPGIRPLLRLAEARVAHRKGEDPMPLLEDGIELARSTGWRLAESVLLREMTCLGHADRSSEPLRVLAEIMGPGRAVLIAREAEAVAQRRPSLLDEVAVESARLGLTGLAADAAAQACRFHADQGRPADALAIGTLVGRLLERLPGQRSVPIQGMPDILTDREREIVGAVVGGGTSREVAAAMFVSHRTVESHLRRIYQRLGISSRAELIRIVTRFDGVTS